MRKLQEKLQRVTANQIESLQARIDYNITKMAACRVGERLLP